MTLIRGVLLAGRFRTQHELNGMSDEDQRNTLIVELANRTNQPVPHFQAMDNPTLAGTGAVLAFLRTTKIRTDGELKRMTDDDQRNTLIVEIGAQNGMGKRRRVSATRNSCSWVSENRVREHSKSPPSFVVFWRRASSALTTS